MPYDPTKSGKAASVIRALSRLGVEYKEFRRVQVEGLNGWAAAPSFVYLFEGLPGAPYARVEAIGIFGLYKLLATAEELKAAPKGSMPSAWAEVRRQARGGNLDARKLWEMRVKVQLKNRRKRGRRG